MGYEQKDIAGFEGRYAVNTDGRCMELQKKKIFKTKIQ